MIVGRITDREKALMRQLHTEGRSHVAIAYILDRDYSGMCMKRLGLPALGKPGGPTGWKHTEETKAKIADRMRARWQDPEFRAKALAELPKAWKAQKPRQRLVPDLSTPEGKRYRKIRDVLGWQAARAICLQSS